jgi:hypothetical protein
MSIFRGYLLRLIDDQVSMRAFRNSSLSPSWSATASKMAGTGSGIAVAAPGALGAARTMGYSEPQVNVKVIDAGEAGQIYRWAR